MRYAIGWIPICLNQILDPPLIFSSKKGADQLPDFNEIGLNFQEVTISSGSRPHHCGVRAAFKIVEASLAAKYIQLKAEYIDAICYLKVEIYM